MEIIRRTTNSVDILLKEFKGSKYPKLVANVHLDKKFVLFHFENAWEVNTFTIYSDIPKLIGSYGFGSDYQLNKRQCTWIKNNRVKLLDLKNSLLSEVSNDSRY